MEKERQVKEELLLTIQRASRFSCSFLQFQFVSVEPSGRFLKFCFTKMKAEIYFTTSDFLVKVFYLRVKVVNQVCAPNTLRENIYFLSSTILQLKWLLKTKWWLDREFLQAMDSRLCPQNLDCWSYVSTACQQQQYKYDQKVQRTGFPDSQSSPHMFQSAFSAAAGFQSIIRSPAMTSAESKNKLVSGSPEFCDNGWLSGYDRAVFS